MQIVVLGMHRSGTSALTRVLSMMGCHLGTDDAFNPATPDNPRGFWEHRDVWALDEQILAALGASWCDVGGLDLERLEPGLRTEFEQRARDIVAALDPHGPWAIKDPRLCVLLPIWRPAFETPVCVLTHRHPIQIAESLAKRDGLPIVIGLALWELHARAALRHSAGLPRVVVDHPALISDPVETSTKLRRELEALGVENLRPPDPADLREFIDPDLFRARRSAAEHEALLTPGQRALARGFEEGSVLTDEPPSPAMPETAELLVRYFGLDAARRDSETARDEAESVRDEKARRVEELAAQIEQASSNLQEAEDRRDHLDRRLDEALHRIDDLARELDTSLRRAHELENNVDQAMHRADELEQRLAERDAELEGARHHLDESGRRVDSLEREITAGLSCATELQALLDLVLGSGRWRLGNSAGEIARKLTLRPRQPQATEHRDRIVAAVEAWRARLRDRPDTPSKG